MTVTPLRPSECAVCSFDYEAELPNLARTYGHYLAKAAARLRTPSALVEIGCGNGFMLEEALRLGFSSVLGIEPSLEAVERSSAAVRPFILNDMLHEGLLQPESADVICLFQVLDHLLDPGSALDLCREALRPGGVVLVLNHDVGALSARVLGRRSPIIDIEHTYLYDRTTLSALCRARGLVVDQIGSAWNWCSVAHVGVLLPGPARLKARLLERLRRSRVGRLNLLLPLGNLYLIARKSPARDAHSRS